MRRQGREKTEEFTRGGTMEMSVGQDLPHRKTSRDPAPVRQKNPQRDAALTESFHRMLDALPMPMAPQWRMVCYGYVQVDVRFLKG
jgi:hypothetical protein